MTAHAPRRLPLTAALATALALLTAAGCSSSPASAAHSGGTTAREAAEQRLEAIGPQLATVLTDYQHGNKHQAYSLALTTSTHLYEGTAEHYVSGVDPAGERQIDPLLAATIPAAISSGQPASQIATLIHRGQALAASCLAAIHKQEASGG